MVLMPNAKHSLPLAEPASGQSSKDTASSTLKAWQQDRYQKMQGLGQPVINNAFSQGWTFNIMLGGSPSPGSTSSGTVQPTSQSNIDGTVLATAYEHVPGLSSTTTTQSQAGKSPTPGITLAATGMST